MAMKELVSGECGERNALMKLATKLQEGNIQQNETLGRCSQRQQYVRDGVLVPQTFDMQTLLDEMNSIQTIRKMARTSPSQENELLDWENECKTQENGNQLLEEQYFQNDPLLSIRNYRKAHPLPSLFSLPHSLYTQQEHDQNVKWAHEYLDENLNSLSSYHSFEIQKTAHEILESMENQESNAIEETTAESWVNEYADKIEQDVINGEINMPDISQEDQDYWQQLQQDWNKLFSQEHFQNEEELLSNGLFSTNKEEYEFEEANPFANHENAFEEGLKMLRQGDLISAILLFEEAVRAKPEHAEAWQYLGTSQAENEQEMLAIAALNKCVELQPGNLTARMALAVSYTNESLQSQACNALKAWIEHHPRYFHLLGSSSSSVKSALFTPSLISSAMFKEIQYLYLAAAQISPQGDIDADIQVGLGVLFNISGEYDKAIDCFRTGVQARVDSADIWNKLGATLANGGKSAEAIEAYRNALELRPEFIRCRYNLGISCINMKSYKEAVEHFLSALNMQKQFGNTS
ncbi:peroxisomal targeting signal 1 receptor-like isoform X2 [Hydractinia symbiolongicarpus]|uniref:peroxisomal targeting signal 1 receptor-like isoform X2 n=1 Tax=Hydractinia symbiolongicarpus TaxID=13093 RepID=UPI002551A8D7|nr:peroxisomal targeting signal 1 receptor-like isoform X2 [Hydractinia symbiolongicarpus]